MEKNILKTILLLFLTMTATIGHAQEWFPVGGKWSYTHKYFWSTPTDVNIMLCTGEAMIGGKLCRVLDRSHGTCASLWSTVYVYEENDVVYIWNGVLEEFVILYDMNKVAGESWLTQTPSSAMDFPFEPPLEVIVDSVTFEEHPIFGTTKFLHVHVNEEDSQYQGVDIIMDKVGGLQQLQAIEWGLCDASYDRGLRCYETSDFLMTITEPCYSIPPSNSTADIELSNINIFPNPTYGKFEVNIDARLNFENMTLYNANQMKVFESHKVDQSATVDLSNYAAGIYFLKIEMENGVMSMHKIVHIN